ncbi:class I SAM-dependent rRNA methyltransferase [Dictyoglomus thermophilum]|uniref:Class I SAM-dependent rRNA methyltransferase n=1 Tax=Dictyoglomus thermophilum TaxID=14 RepID=A0A7V3ZIM9_DICTH|nr:class I SAM-dependent rRNA methyltransferase [Dictyoglomus thermophilum]TYT21081.1 class I SAM-dependent rRNA methyltransferase [Dictyoglomus thermophilum]
MTERAKVLLKKGVHTKIVRGNPWIYDNEILKVEGDFSPGDVVDIYDSSKSFIGRGFINPNSKIRVRVVTRKEEEINKDFFRERILKAWEYRKKVVDVDSCRVVFAEADFLPGLIVDKFSDVLVIQTLALGIDRFKEVIVEVLDEIFNPIGIYERNDVSVRELEGLPQVKGFLKGKFDTKVEILENGIKMIVDVENGQKTGYFLDQRENRASLKGLVDGAEVLDVFCYTGGFSLHALKYGASKVIAVDSSSTALEMAKENAKINGFIDKIEFIEENAFDLLRRFHKEGKTFDVVILDPPAFAKSSKNLDGALRGYKEINLRAMKIIRDGGFLITCSCSQHVTRELFEKVIESASFDANRLLRLVEFRYQAKDHPILLSHPESLYLKCGIYQVFKKL